MSDSVSVFVRPPEAPVFEPTWDEFKDPLIYIDKIRPIGEKYGLCKIRPPPSWQPPFAVDVETFKFIPRIQKLNELEALSRVKVNFIEQLTKFWHLQGIALQIPLLERRYIDLYMLRKFVNNEGGFEEVCKLNRWSYIVPRMGYSSSKGYGSQLKTHYEKIILPYDIFMSGASLSIRKNKNKDLDILDSLAISYTLEKLAKDGKLKKMRRMAMQCYKRNNEDSQNLKCHTEGTKITIKSNKEEGIKKESGFGNTVDQYFCEVCEGGDDDPLMLLCDGCDHAYHTYCLVPPLAAIPPGDWRCPICVAQEVCKPLEAYGFEQSNTEYTLEQFCAMADQFKANYFKMPPQSVPLEMCEREFWRLVSCLEEDVSVEYGADIHSGELGSGFPTEKTKHRFLGDEEYISSGWNLNNLPVLDLSVLRHVSDDISGMMVPWCYVGMCFASFSWHNEDHWSYSVNYMHWGEPKTWYGVPGSKAELLEEAMMKEAPELFVRDPDLLHQLTTILNPNILMKYGVPIFRTDQKPGEFVITFPRSYHAGFNQGYNFAEAVNFCPPDWVAFGRSCIEDYRRLKRQCVFSHEQLLCEMAENASTLNLRMASVVYDDLKIIIDRERVSRQRAKQEGVTISEQQNFHKVQNDDERQCDICRTTLYLSAIACPIIKGTLVCLEHEPLELSCSCGSPSGHILKFWYTCDELEQLGEKLKSRSHALEDWKLRVENAIKPGKMKKLDILDLKDLVSEVEIYKLPVIDLLDQLKDKILIAESCIDSARDLMNKKINSIQMHSPKVSVNELKSFCDRVKDLCCTFKEAILFQDLLDNAGKFQMEVGSVLSSDMMPAPAHLQQLIDWGSSLDIEFPEFARLTLLLQHSRWYQDFLQAFNISQNNPALLGSGDSSNSSSPITIQVLQKLVVGAAPQAQALIVGAHPLYLAASTKVRNLLMSAEDLELRAIACLRDRPMLSNLESVITDSREVFNFVHLPNITKLNTINSQANQWMAAVHKQSNRGHGLHLSELMKLSEEGRAIPVQLELLTNIESKLTQANEWVRRVHGTFFDLDKPQTILKIWFTQIGIDFNKLSESNCQVSALMPTSLHGVVRSTVESLKEATNASTRKLLDQGREGSACLCGRTVTDHVRCCMLCTHVYLADCKDLLPTSPKSIEIIAQFAPSPPRSDLPPKEVHLCNMCRGVGDHRITAEEVKMLVKSFLQMSGVCLCEGRALLCLAELISDWQMRCRKILSSRELVIAVGLLNLSASDMKAEEARARGYAVPSRVLQLLTNPVFHPRLQSLGVPHHLQAAMVSLLTESAALGVESEEASLMRSLLYACYQQVVLMESMKREEEQRRRKEEEEKARKLEEEQRKIREAEEELLRKEEEEKKKREHEKLRKQEKDRKSEEDRMKKLERERKAEEEKTKKAEKEKKAEDERIKKAERDKKVAEERSKREKTKAEERSHKQTEKPKHKCRLSEDNNTKLIERLSDISDGSKKSDGLKLDSYKKIQGADRTRHGERERIRRLQEEEDLRRMKKLLDEERERLGKSRKRRRTDTESDGRDKKSLRDSNSRGYHELDEDDEDGDNFELNEEWRAFEEKRRRIEEAFARLDAERNSRERKEALDNSLKNQNKKIDKGGKKSRKSTNKQRKKALSDDDNNEDNKNIDDEDDDIISAKEDESDIEEEKGSEEPVSLRCRSRDNSKGNSGSESRIISPDRGAKVKTKVKVQKSKKSVTATTATAEEEDEEEKKWEVCSLERCLKPTGAKVDWVQCDTCECWYHLICVGIDMLPAENEEYVCQKCTPTKRIVEPAITLKNSKFIDKKSDKKPDNKINKKAVKLPESKPIKSFSASIASQKINEPETILKQPAKKFKPSTSISKDKDKALNSEKSKTNNKNMAAKLEPNKNSWASKVTKVSDIYSDSDSSNKSSSSSSSLDSNRSPIFESYLYNPWLKPNEPKK